MAASTCSQRPYWRAIRAIAAMGSSAVVAVVPVVPTMAHGLRPAARSARMACFQCVGAKCEVFVVGDVADVIAAEAGQQRRLIHRAVAVRRGVDHQRLRFRLQSAAIQPEIGGALAGAEQRDQGAGGGGVLNHPAPFRGEAGHAAHPIGHHFFDFGERGTGLPGEAEDAESGGEIVAEDAGEFAVGREVAEETGMLPVGEAGHDDSVEIGQDRVEGFGLLRRIGGQGRLDFARRGSRHHGAFGDGGAIVGDAVDDLVAEVAKFFRRHSPSKIACLTEESPP